MNSDVDIMVRSTDGKSGLESVAKKVHVRIIAKEERLKAFLRGTGKMHIFKANNK
jgi:hypothetical protein